MQTDKWCIIKYVSQNCDVREAAHPKCSDGGGGGGGRQRSFFSNFPDRNGRHTTDLPLKEKDRNAEEGTFN